MNKLTSRIAKLAKKQKIKNQKPVALVMIKNNESEDEALKRHFQEKPEDKNAKLIIKLRYIA